MSADLKTFDLREEYRRNAEPWEPFSKIVFAAEELAAGGELVLIAPFEPTVLLRLLRCMGFAQRTVQSKPGLWEIVVHKTPDQVCNQRAEIDLDLRGLPALPPLEKICHAFTLLPWQATLRIRTDARPQPCPTALLAEGISKRVERQPDGTFLSIIRHADRV